MTISLYNKNAYDREILSRKSCPLRQDGVENELNCGRAHDVRFMEFGRD